MTRFGPLRLWTQPSDCEIRLSHEKVRRTSYWTAQKITTHATTGPPPLVILRRKA